MNSNEVNEKYDLQIFGIQGVFKPSGKDAEFLHHTLVSSSREIGEFSGN